VNQEESKQNEVYGMKKGDDSTGTVAVCQLLLLNEYGMVWYMQGDAYLKERLVICNEEDTDGRARVTADEERVLELD